MPELIPTVEDRITQAQANVALISMLIFDHAVRRGSDEHVPNEHLAWSRASEICDEVFKDLQAAFRALESVSACHTPAPTVRR